MGVFSFEDCPAPGYLHFVAEAASAKGVEGRVRAQAWRVEGGSNTVQPAPFLDGCFHVGL